ncbi:isoleucine--tRNA ligase [Candidatus Parcubacteria bacterium]|nr:MAG: isoleucine--tRNA ligase [Candidatus Parcubacteria bacterium]
MSNFKDKEKEILDFWDKEKIFQKTLDKEAPNGDYAFYDGPPFATGLPHYGHILSSVIKDVVPRYWTMKGYHVRRRWGWDCHGLPIENLVEQKLQISGKKEIEKMGVDVFNNTCHSEVLRYAEQWKDMVNRIGRWVEFDNSYKTMDSTYMESVWWALKIIWDKGLIYEGRKVLLYCPRCETPVSKFEVAMDNSYKDVVDTAVTIKFKLKSGQKLSGKDIDNSTYILAWTTTPWTLPGNVALAVGKDINYLKFKDEKTGEVYIVAEDRAQDVLKYYPEEESHEYKQIGDIKGKDLLDLEYEPLYEIPAVAKSGKKSHYITNADFVTTEDGTGVVHTAVIYGEDDFNLGLEIDLPMIPLLDDKGVFNEEAPDLIRGMAFKDSEDKILEDLKSRKLFFASEEYTHSYPHCWRCENPLFYNAIEAWFINIQKIKDKLVKLNEKINWYPDHLKHGRFLNNIESAPDWNISRNRYWASALPFWKCTEKNCSNIVCVGSVADLKERALNFDEVYETDNIEQMDLHKHVIDRVELKCDCGGAMKRVPEVIDCWVESASMPFAEFHYPFDNKEVFEKRFPGQYIAEYIAQTRTWFYYMHAMSTLLFDNISFENVVTTGTILNEKGEKMSKSKRNFPDPWKLIDTYGADSLRFYLMSSVVMQAENLNFSDDEVRQVYSKVVNPLVNVLNFYLLYQNEEALKLDVNKDDIMDSWILTKINVLLENVTKEMDNYNTVKSTRYIMDFVQELSTWYIRRSRARFKNEDSRNQAIATLHYVLIRLAKIMAPFTPFVAESIWKETNNTELESVHLSDWPEIDKKYIDKEVLEQMDLIRSITETVHAIRAKAGIKVRQPLAKVVVSKKVEDAYKDILAEELNVESVEASKEIKEQDGWELAETNNFKVALDTNLTDDLKDKGVVREIIRFINALRKDSGLKPSDRPVETYQTDSKYLQDIIVKFKDEIITGTSAGMLEQVSDSPEPNKGCKINGEEIILGLKI